MRLILPLVLMFSLAFVPFQASAATSTQSVLISVKGKVEVLSQDLQKTRKAHKDSKVLEGESVKVGKKSSATLRLFDDSELVLGANSQLKLAKVQQPSLKDKILKFGLSFGQVVAKVQKLLTARSSFEIEAGGVVCGVRGTQFLMTHNPGHKTVQIHVDDGTVYANSNGHTYLFTAGQTGTFQDGQLTGPAPPPNQGVQGSNKGGSNGDNGSPATDLSLLDLRQQADIGLLNNGDNTLNDPWVEGSVNLTIRAQVSALEAVP